MDKRRVIAETGASSMKDMGGVMQAFAEYVDGGRNAELVLAGPVVSAVADDPEVRGPLRERAKRWGLVGSARVPGSEDAKGVYRTYYEFEGRADRLRPHQVLALNRGEAEKVLRDRRSLYPRSG